ncbi:hypothetical protein HPB47_018841 [Ixodes persulcatus]|uniref:Uncharacterized protein n=1 Tax=Ixodes persulcatus TaxID=34615 RepID=A0AC60QKJ5_IXOPE|nr:hypothetical protein HPB47_018841 [Ixodes persulcatus]
MPTDTVGEASLPAPQEKRFFHDPVQEDSEGKWAREVRGRVRDAETAHWMEEAGKKSTLDVYRAHKHNIRAEDFYDNSLGSRLLFEARAGVLRTLAYRQRFDPTIMTIQCRLCDQEAETIEHLVLRCPVLTPKWELADTQANQASSHDSGRQATPPASVHGGCRVTATTAPQPAQAPPLAEALGFQEAADSRAHPAERWGPMWRQIRGQGLSYNYNLFVRPCDGLLYFCLTKSSLVAAAYGEALQIVERHLSGEEEWDEELLESSRSSLMFEVVEKEKSVNEVALQSLLAYHRGIDMSHTRLLLERVAAVSLSDLLRVGRQYLRPLFDPATSKLAICCHPSKVEDTVAAFKE